ncbi:MAG: TonB family protein [Geobacteraceae bacterium]
MPIKSGLKRVKQSAPAEWHLLIKISGLSLGIHVVALATMLTLSDERKPSPYLPPPMLSVDLRQPGFSRNEALTPPRRVSRPLPLPQAIPPRPLPATVSYLSANSLIPTAAPSPAKTATRPPLADGPLAVIPGDPGGSPREPVHEKRADIPPSSFPETGSVRSDYLALCRRLIENNKDYPLMARKGRIEGAVLARCVLERTGALKSSGVSKSSGSGLLDNAALRAVLSVGRFPPLPPELPGSELVLDIPITFRLVAY